MKSSTYWIDREMQAFQTGKPSLVGYLSGNANEGFHISTEIPTAVDQLSIRASNTSFDEMKRMEKEIHYKLRSNKDFSLTFFEVGSVHSEELTAYEIKPENTGQRHVELHTGYAEFRKKYKHRFAIPTIRNHELTQIVIESDPGKPLLLGQDYRVLQDSKTGHFVVELVNMGHINEFLDLNVKFQDSSQKLEVPQKISHLKIDKLKSLILDLRQAGFLELADSLSAQISEKSVKGEAVTLDLIQDVFQKTGHYSYLPESGATSSMNTHFKEWSKFLVDGKFYGQCDSSNQFAYALFK